jgi:MinD superfamily P-loop ATPase
MDEHCTLCGDCSEFCRYNALALLKDSVLFFPELCHHCGGCALACTHGAIEEKNTVIGRVETGAAGRIKFVHGISEVGTSESTAIIQEEKSLAGTDEVTIIDAAPGTSCLMVEALRGSDYCILNRADPCRPE